MPKKDEKTALIYNYVLSFFKNRYNERIANKITRKGIDTIKYPNMESIVNLVLENKLFHETNSISEKQLEQISVSRPTIRKAIKKLVDENKIAIFKGSYEFVPHMTESVNQHPILDIASKIDVSIGVPEDMLVLSVSPEYTYSMTRYLSALFYKGDVIFIPISSKILCISVFPAEVIATPSRASNHLSALKLRQRIELALQTFNSSYPQFTFGHHYELAFYAAHNSDIISATNKIAKAVEDERPFRSESSIFKSLQNALYFSAENPYTGQSNDLSADNDPTPELETGPRGYPSQEEWDFMDSPIMRMVDDELTEYK